MEGAGRIVIVGTFDTKGEEHAHLRRCIQQVAPQHELITVNVGTVGSTQLFPVNYEATKVMQAIGKELSATDRGEAMKLMHEAAPVFLRTLHRTLPFLGIVGLGGSAGTSIITAAMRALPFHVAKVCMSTIGGGDVTGFAAGSNIVFVPSIVDVAGLNRISNAQIHSTACVVSGMVSGMVAKGAEVETKESQRTAARKPVVVASMFGNTTTCVDNARKLLTDEHGYEVLVFHSVGTGGRSMESVLDADDSLVDGVLDLTTTEWADELCGGVFSSGPERLDRPGQLGISHLIAPGCLDMVNFGARATVPDKYRDRQLYEWNPSVTLMRTNAEENARLGKILADKANAATGPVAFLLPLRGVSILDADGGKFCDREADQALFDAIKANVRADIPVYEIDANINDAAFSQKAVAVLLELIAKKREKEPKAEGDRRQPKDDGVQQKAAPGERRVHAPIKLQLPVPPTTIRETILTRLLQNVNEGKPIVGGGAGCGISAKFEEAGGVDMIVIYNSGRFRMAGRGSLAGLLPYKDANAIVMEMAGEVLPIVKNVPVLAGVCATDPFRNMDQFLKQIKKTGFAGVQNFPTVGLIDGNFRKNLEETGMSYQLEVDMIRKARQLGLLTTPYVFNAEEAKLMAAAGADIIVAHMGLTTAGSIGAQTALTLDQCVTVIQDITDAARSIRDDVIVLCHGGPISMPEDAEYILQRTQNVHGFYGASSMERLPTEVAITEQMRKFKGIKY